jgi:hypothetical protein
MIISGLFVGLFAMVSCAELMIGEFGCGSNHTLPESYLAKYNDSVWMNKHEVNKKLRPCIKEAIEIGNLGFIERYLRITDKSYECDTDVVSAALSSNYLGIAQYVLSKYKFCIQYDSLYWDSIDHQIKKANFEILKALLSVYEPNKEKEYSFWYFRILLSIKYANFDIFNELYSRGSNIVEVTEDYLYNAIDFNSSVILEVLLRDLLLPDDRFLLAVGKKTDPVMIKLLLFRNSPCKSIHILKTYVERENAELEYVKLMIHHKCNCDESVIDSATKNGHSEIAQWLTSKCLRSRRKNFNLKEILKYIVKF